VPIIEFIARRLRELRRVHGLTQEQVATLLGTDSRWYQRIEQKEKDIRASTIDRLASVFGVTFSEFLSEEMPTTKVRMTPTAPHKPRKAGARKSEKRK
jgi:transcriptional regulator with XRE-family HTH domain